MERAGKLKKNLSGKMTYQSFLPSPLPPDPPILMDAGAVKLLAEATRQLAMLEGIKAHIPNMPLFISMYVRKEALLSSQIEGTQASLDDVLDPSAAENANLNVTDVVRYIRATDFAMARRETLPLCNRLIRETHAVLMAGGRGQDKGEFRRSQNWIGGQGSSLRNARYIPPAPEDLPAALSNLETYINGDDPQDVLVNAALIHYQFETIHPFLDGNGRIGRLLICLYMLEKGALTAPSLYISLFLKQNRLEYYDRLSEVRNGGNYEQWINFFLRAVRDSAADAVTAVHRLSALHNANTAAIKSTGRAAKTAERLLAYLEANPIIEVRKTAAALGVSFKTASGAVMRLRDMGILAQTAGARRNRMFAYTDYLDILREGT